MAGKIRVSPQNNKTGRASAMVLIVSSNGRSNVY